MVFKRTGEVVPLNQKVTNTRVYCRERYNTEFGWSKSSLKTHKEHCDDLIYEKLPITFENILEVVTRHSYHLKVVKKTIE